MKTGIARNILLFYAILFAVNIPAPFLGLKFEDGGNADAGISIAPPGFVIPIVWWILFTLLGVAHYLVRQSAEPRTADSALLIGLGFLCATYAYYTLGLEALTGVSALWFGLVGNLVVIVAALAIAGLLYGRIPVAACLVAPVAVWTSYATLIVIAELRAARML